MSDFNQNSLSEIVKLIKTLPKKDSLFETIIVSANDCLVRGYSDGRAQKFQIAADADTTYFKGGNVGIGTTTPAATLDVNGDQ